jgi:hypothetical protein
MNEKLKKIAKNLSSIVSEVENPTSVYYKLLDIFRIQSDYFSHFDLPSKLKIVLYVWSLKSTGNFALGDKIINNLFFMVLFQTEMQNHVDECDQCNGNGNMSCDVCDGSGRVECGECSGDGEVYGDEGEGPQVCDDCDGEGEVECDNCEGHGDTTCDSCDGSGEFEYDDQFDYDIKICCSWDKSLFESAELAMDTEEPLMEDSDWSLITDNLIVLSEDSGYGEIKNFVDANEIYCIYLDDNAPLEYNFNNRGFSMRNLRTVLKKVVNNVF